VTFGARSAAFEKGDVLAKVGAPPSRSKNPAARPTRTTQAAKATRGTRGAVGAARHHRIASANTAACTAIEPSPKAMGSAPRTINPARKNRPMPSHPTAKRGSDSVIRARRAATSAAASPASAAIVAGSLGVGIIAARAVDL
jgi:hypothetical protein